jgi:hypothetical protein
VMAELAAFFAWLGAGRSAGELGVRGVTVQNRSIFATLHGYSEYPYTMPGGLRSCRRVAQWTPILGDGPGGLICATYASCDLCWRCLGITIECGPYVGPIVGPQL